MATWRHDLLYASRRLAKSPGFAAAAVVSIGLGIAANSTVFSMIDRFVLHRAPVSDPDTLMALHTTHQGECCNNFSWPLFSDLRARTKSFSAVAGYYDLLPGSVGGAGEPERVWGQATTANFFDVAQLKLTLGRGFLREEEHAPVVVIGNGIWRRRFGSDPAIVGKSVMLSSRPFTVVGVAPPGFRGLDLILDCQFWVPIGNLDELLPNTANYPSRDYHWIDAAARLRSGVTHSQAAAELAVLARQVAQSYAQDKDGGFRFEPAGSLPPRDSGLVQMFLAALSVVALLVLGIACANVANLLLAQAAGRQREMAVRLALGATRAHLVRQTMSESLLLALGGGLLGVALSLWATQALAAFHFSAPVPLDLTLRIDWRVLLYTFGLSAATGLLCGIAPGWVASRPVLAAALKGEDILARPGRRWTMRNVLVVSQIAMSVVLLCATGLFLRSLRNAYSMDIGFRSQGILSMSIDPRVHGYTPERTARFLNELRRRVAGLPGVAAAACTDVVPLSGYGRSDGFAVEGQPNSAESPIVDLLMASPDYFETLGIPLVAGRDFANEPPSGLKTAVVNRIFAQRFFGNHNPIGRRVVDGGNVYEIVGVVNSMKSRTLGAQLRPVLFRSLDQSVAGDPSLMGYAVLVRAADGAPMAALAAAVRRQIHALDPALAIYDAETMEEHLRGALFLPRLGGALFGVFGLAGLLLAAVGLYGVMSYSTARRTREIGIRLALGAQRSQVQKMVVRQGMLLALAAVALGLSGAWAVSRFAASFLYGVSPHDLLTFTGVPLFLAPVAFVACWLPSRQAARLDPLTALRHE
ncbi:MAG: ABC transporter permease [Bryobacteraceae bacterium]